MTKESIVKKYSSITYRRFLQIMEGDIILKKYVISFQLQNLEFSKLELLTNMYKDSLSYDVDFISHFMYLIKYARHSNIYNKDYINSTIERNKRFINETELPTLDDYPNTFRNIRYSKFHLMDKAYFANRHSFYGSTGDPFFNSLSVITEYHNSGTYFNNYNILNIYFNKIINELRLFNKSTNTSNIENAIIQYLDLYEDIFYNLFDLYDIIKDKNHVYSILNDRYIIDKLSMLRKNSLYENTVYDAIYNKEINKNYKQYFYSDNRILYINDHGIIKELKKDKDTILKTIILLFGPCYLTEELLEDKRLYTDIGKYIYKYFDDFIIMQDKFVPKIPEFDDIYEYYSILFDLAGKHNWLVVDKIRKYIDRFCSSCRCSINELFCYIMYYRTLPDDSIESVYHEGSLSYNKEGIPKTSNIRYIVDDYILANKYDFNIILAKTIDLLKEKFKEKFNRYPKIVDTIGRLIFYKIACLNFDKYENLPLDNAIDIINVYVNTFNIKNIKHIASLNSPVLLDIATKYDISHLKLDVLLYFHYYELWSIRYRHILDSNILKYLVKNGNKLSNDNLSSICKNIDILIDKEYINMKEINRIILENRGIIEKNKYEEEYSEFEFSNNTCILKDNPISLGKYRMYMLKPDDLRLFTVGLSTDCCYHYEGAAEDSLLYSVYMPNSTALVIEDKNKDIKAQAWVWYNKEDDVLVLDNIEFANDQDIEYYIDIIREYVKNSPYQNIHMGMGYNELDESLFKDPEEAIYAAELPLKYDDMDFTTVYDDLNIYTDYKRDNFVVMKHKGICYIKEKKK